MPDSYVLYPPDGASPVQLASWIELPKGDPDFGGKGLLNAGLTTNAMAPGGQLTWEQFGLRTMTFPLLIGSHSSFGGLAGAESLLRGGARPGGWIDIQPEGVPSSEAVRFDIVTGRYEENYGLRLQSVSRRRGDLVLQTQPFGYWPTWITLASAASVGLPGSLTIPTGQVVGDMPAGLRIFVAPTNAGTSFVYNASQYWRTDLLGWSLGGRGGASHFAIPLDTGLFSAPLAPFGGGQHNVADTQNLGGPSLTSWAIMGRSSVFGASGGAADLRGARFHAFGFVRLEASQAYPYAMALDLVSEGNPSVFLATWYGRVATLAPDLTTASWVAGASPAYTMLDFGEVVSPLSPSSASGADESGIRARLWFKGNGTGLSNSRFDIGGIFLLRTDGLHGVLQQGMIQPHYYLGASNASEDFHIDSSRRRVELGGATTTGGARRLYNPLNISQFYYGDAAPYVSGTSALGP